MNFLISGAFGDFIHCLYVTNFFYKKGISKINLYVDKFHFRQYDIQNVMMELNTLINHQPYINNFEIYNNQEININLNKFRESDYLSIDGWTDIFCKTFNIDMYLEPWVYTEYNPIYKDNIVIHRSTQRHNQNFPWEKIINKYKNKILFVSKNKVDYDLFPYKNDITYYQVENLYELSIVINSCKFFIGNQSLPFALAHSLNKNRFLELFVDIHHYKNEEKYYDNFCYYYNDNIKKINIEL